MKGFAAYTAIFVLLLSATAFSSDTAFHLVPEYKKSRAVVYSLADVQFRAKWYPGIYSERFEKERIEMYRTLAEGLPEVQHIFLVNHQFDKANLDASILLKSSLVTSLSKKGIRVQLIEVDREISASLTEWTRDQIGFSAKDKAGQNYLVSFSKHTSSINRALSDVVDFHFIDALRDLREFSFEGGNIMVNEDGTCFSVGAGGGQEEHQLDPFCQRRIMLPSLLLEGTQHIDLFAKIVAPNTAVLGTYSSTDVEVLSDLQTVTYKCNEEQIAAKSYWGCSEIKFDRSATQVDLKRTAGREPFRIPYEGIADYSKSAFPGFDEFMFDGPHGLLPFSKAPVSVNWKDHGRQSLEILENANIRVKLIPQPQPMLKYSLALFADKNGRIIHRILTVAFVFRSFTNSLVTNGKAFIPVYPSTAPPSMNARASFTYRSLGLKTKSIPSDYSILGGGAIHCLTHEIAD